MRSPTELLICPPALRCDLEQCSGACQVEEVGAGGRGERASDGGHELREEGEEKGAVDPRALLI